jgi:hypothetical protein
MVVCKVSVTFCCRLLRIALGFISLFFGIQKSLIEWDLGLPNNSKRNKACIPNCYYCTKGVCVWDYSTNSTVEQLYKKLEFVEYLFRCSYNSTFFSSIRVRGAETVWLKNIGQSWKREAERSQTLSKIDSAQLAWPYNGRPVLEAVHHGSAEFGVTCRWLTAHEYRAYDILYWSLHWLVAALEQLCILHCYSCGLWPCLVPLKMVKSVL